MIRKSTNNDLEKIMQIWLDTNISVHNYILQEYWTSNEKYVKEAIQEAEVYVYEENKEIKGFIGINKGHIEGIFVEEKYRNQGIGKKLLSYCKNKYDKLTLEVYSKNTKAINFYEREQFKPIKEDVDEANNEVEIFMEWKKN